MSRAIGLDLGHTYAKVAIRGSNGKPRLVGEEGQPDIRAFVLERNDAALVGREAMRAALEEERGLGFMHHLGSDSAQDEELAADSSVVQRARGQFQIFAEHLNVLCPELTSQGEPESIVIALPETWRHTPMRASMLVAETFGRVFSSARIRLVSSAQAAAAHSLAHADRSILREGDHLLLCDVGGHSVQLSLFAIERDDVLRLVTHGSAEASGGEAFDKAVVADTESLERRDHRVSPGWQTFENARREENNLPFLARFTDEDFWERISTPIFPMPDGEAHYNVGNIRKAFESIELRVEGVVRQVVSDPKCPTGVRVALVGGFGWFPPMQRLFKESLRPLNPVIIDKGFNDSDRLSAAAFGALGIAEGTFDPIGRYPRQVSIPLHRVASGRLLNVTEVIAKKDQIEIGCYLPLFGASSPIMYENNDQLEGDGICVVTVGSISMPIDTRQLPNSAYRIGLHVNPFLEGRVVFQSITGRGHQIAQFGKVPIDGC